jgi:hypothetical protein
MQITTEFAQENFLGSLDSLSASPAVPQCNLHAYTPVQDLGLPKRCQAKLLKDSYKFLEDLSLLTAHQFRRLPGVDEEATARLSQALSGVDLSFQAPRARRTKTQDQAEMRRARAEIKAVRNNKLPGALKLDPKSAISRLGLRRTYHEALIQKRITTIVQAAELPLREADNILGHAGVRALYEGLRAYGLDFADKPDTFALWYYNVYKAAELDFEINRDSPLKHLAPKLTLRVTALLERVGVRTVGEFLAKSTIGFDDVPMLRKSYLPLIHKTVAETQALLEAAQ